MNEEELRHRIKNAIVLLAAGHSFTVGDLLFACIDKSNFSVTGWTNSKSLQNLTKETALLELNEIKELFKRMIVTSPELSIFIKGRQIEYNLGLDYGKGGIGICSEINGQLKWDADLS